MWSREVLIVRGLVIMFLFEQHVVCPECASTLVSILLGCVLVLTSSSTSQSISQSTSRFHPIEPTAVTVSTVSVVSAVSINQPSSDFPTTEQSLGDDCAGDTPLPIPNRVVKPRCADGTASELVWQSR